MKNTRNAPEMVYDAQMEITNSMDTLQIVLESMDSLSPRATKKEIALRHKIWSCTVVDTLRQLTDTRNDLRSIEDVIGYKDDLLR